MVVLFIIMQKKPVGIQKKEESSSNADKENETSPKKPTVVPRLSAFQRRGCDIRLFS